MAYVTFIILIGQSNTYLVNISLAWNTQPHAEDLFSLAYETIPTIIYIQAFFRIIITRVISIWNGVLVFWFTFNGLNTIFVLGYFSLLVSSSLVFNCYIFGRFIIFCFVFTTLKNFLLCFFYTRLSFLFLVLFRC